MTRENKIELIKQCLAVSNEGDFDESDWEDLMQEHGFPLFLNAFCLAIDKHFSEQANSFLRFVRSNYTPHAPFCREWKDEKRNVIVGEESVVSSFGLSQNIKKVLETIPVTREPKHYEDDGAYAD